ncbi:MAG: TetR/AcrR family transcriptional regulator [Acidobacteria bacterium]|nr:TetR/AcrR family transcriptional regulator [Acidobacteriota bacterium]
MAYRTTAKMLERKEARRRVILAAATRLFGQQGYHATTVPMIVAEAGTSTGNFYFYFRNKEDVFAAALSNLGERISAAINDAIAQAPTNPLLHMKAAVEGFVLFLAQNPEEARILIVESSGLSSRLEEIRRTIIASHSRGVENALRLLAPKLPPLEPGVTARCWTGAVYEAVYSWLELPEDKRTPAKAVAEAVARFNLRGIGASPDLL